MKPNILTPADQRLVQVTADLQVNPCVITRNPSGQGTIMEVEKT